MCNPFSLKNKVAVITGCNKGLGFAMAIALADAGADIVAVNRSDSESLKTAILEKGCGFLSVQADLTTIKSVDYIVDEAVKVFGKVDILINNAGMIKRADALDFSETDWDAVMDINLKTVFFLSQAFAKQLVKQGHGGKIINIASMLSFQGGVRVPSYTASKSGVMGITRLMANEWAKYGIHVNAIAPGYMATDNTKAIREDAFRENEILSRIPAGRWGEPDDLSGPVVFLASSASDYVNGFTLAVDGGWLAR